MSITDELSTKFPVLRGVMGWDKLHFSENGKDIKPLEKKHLMTVKSISLVRKTTGMGGEDIKEGNSIIPNPDKVKVLFSKDELDKIETKLPVKDKTTARYDRLQRALGMSDINTSSSLSLPYEVLEDLEFKLIGIIKVD